MCFEIVICFQSMMCVKLFVIIFMKIYFLLYELLAYPSYLPCLPLNFFFCYDHLPLGVSRKEFR